MWTVEGILALNNSQKLLVRVWIKSGKGDTGLRFKKIACYLSIIFETLRFPLKVPDGFFNIGQGIIFATCSGDIF
jgi:hypothetical protein